MAAKRLKLEFPGHDGSNLAGLYEAPSGDIKAYALFAHCFTCGKDIAAASRISRALVARGFAVLRFDITGLGDSDDDFANTNFSSNVGDLVAAANHMRTHLSAPSILIGHSLGGAAVLAAAGQVAEATAVVTIGAPADPAHVAHNFQSSRAEIEKNGEAEVLLVGRPFKIQKQFLDDIEGTLITAFTIDSMKISNKAPRNYSLYLEKLAEIIPDSYERYIVEFVVFKSLLDIDAYVISPFGERALIHAIKDILNPPVGDKENFPSAQITIIHI